MSQLEVADTGQPSPQARLIQGLRPKELLLVLDNFEQLIAAAPLLAMLVAECPGLHLLVTSRERLHLRAEQRFLVSPLDLDFAVALFVQQAQALDPTFELTLDNQPILQTICRRLDCLPLAIELVAARSDLFSPKNLLNRLQRRRLDLLADGAQDLPERQRTLRKAIQYSYVLLTAHDQQLFRTLGVFVDGFDLAAVAHFKFEAEALQGLLNKSLVHVAARSSADTTYGDEERRFLLLETLRDYALEQLVVHQEADAVQQQHAAYYTQWVETVEANLQGAQAKAYVAKLEAEHNNVRAALTWTLAQRDAETALRLSGALSQFWIIHGHIQEGKAWLAKALALDEHVPSAGQAKARMAAGLLESVIGNPHAVQRFFEQSLDFYRASNDRQNMAWGLLNLGGAFYSQNAYPQAKALFQQGLDLYQALKDKRGLADAYTNLGWLAMSEGDNQQAKAHFVQGAAVWREQGEKEIPITLLKGLAAVASQQQDYQQAIAYYAELLARHRAIADAYGIAHTLTHLGRIALYQGDLAQATRYLAEGFGAAQALDNPVLLQFALDNQGSLAFAQGYYEVAINYYRQSLSITWQIQNKFNTATLFERLAGVLGAEQKAEQAARLLGAAANLHETIGAPLRPLEQARYQAILTVIHAQLDEITYANAYAAGYAMTIDQSVAFAQAPFAEP